MPAVPAPATVLVTGASGFLGTHVSRAFLARGYSVRGTVRSPAKGEYLQKLFEADFPGKFTFAIVKDISAPGAFDDSVKGIDAIAHTASPFELVEDGVDPDVLIKPAVQGTTGILKSAKEFGTAVRRIVVTSSVAAIDAPKDGPYVYTENDWNEVSVNEVKEKGSKAAAAMKYSASKTLAERSLWDFISSNKSDIKFDAVTCNPPFLYAPVVHQVDSKEKLNTSSKKMLDLLTSPLPEKEEELGDWVGDWFDARDLAEIQVDAIEREDLGGCRLVLGRGPLTRQDFLDAAHQVATKKLHLPFEIPAGRPGYGDSKRNTFTSFSDASAKLIGRKFSPLPDTISDTLESLIRKKLL